MRRFSGLICSTYLPQQSLLLYRLTCCIGYLPQQSRLLYSLVSTAVLPVVEVDLVDCEVGSEADHPPGPDLLVGVGTRVPPVSRVSVTIHPTVRVAVPSLR